MPKKICEECERRDCKGPGELRSFDDWADLASHLSEDDILRLINHLNEIGPRYERLSDAEAERKTRQKAYQIQQRELRNVARKALSRDEVEAIKKWAEQKAAEKAEKEDEWKSKSQTSESEPSLKE